MKLDNTIAAVVTGGASGLGEATARALAAKGAKVAIFDMNAERGEAIAAEIGGVFCAVNVTDDASVIAGFAKARAAHGQERILVNCAGIATGEKVVVVNALSLSGSRECLSAPAVEGHVRQSRHDEGIALRGFRIGDAHVPSSSNSSSRPSRSASA